MLQTECGYTPSEIGQMTLLDVQRLGQYWRHRPPMTVLLRMLLRVHGVKIEELLARSEQLPGQPGKYLTAEQFAAIVPAMNAYALGQ